MVKDRGARERERDVGSGGDGGTAGGSEKKSECGWRGGEELSGCESGGVRGGWRGDGVWVCGWVSEGGARRGEGEVTEAEGGRLAHDGGGE